MEHIYGRAVRLICTDRKFEFSNAQYPVVALIKGIDNTDYAISFTIDGKATDCCDCDRDLFFATKKEKRKNKYQGWINIYEHSMNIRYPSFTIYNTEKEAKKERGNKCIATIKIQWEE